MVNLSPGRYFIYGEVNKSFDYNETYPEERTGVNGQPSLVYRGTVYTDTATGTAHSPASLRYRVGRRESR
jgi:hypothetical protein